MGPKVAALEKAFAEYVGVRHAVAVSNGTAALDVALKALGIRPGAEVIIPDLAYIATANAVRYQYAVPVVADVDPGTFTLNPDDVERRITSRTKAVIPIDYGGLSSDCDRLQEICDEYGLVLLKDGAHSLGGEWRGRNLLAMGRMSTLSLHTAKVMTSIEGGMVFTNDENLAAVSRMLRNQGEDPNQKYFHPLIGHNYRMTDVHAGFGLAQFARLEAFLARRREIAEAYTRAFAEHESIRLQRIPKGAKHAWFFYAILVPNRERVAKELQERGVETRSWPYPVHTQPPYKDLAPKPGCPNAEFISSHVLNLPLFYEMTKGQQDYVIDSVLHILDTMIKEEGPKRTALLESS